MAHRFNDRGSYVIDRRYRGIGRIRRASGTTDKATHGQILSMLRELHNTGRHTVLREVRDGVISPIEVYGFWLEGRLDHLPSAATLRPIKPTIPDWIDSHAVADTTKRNYKSEIDRFAKFADESLKLADLPSALKKYKVHCDERGTQRTFNYLRTAILAFLRNNFGKSHTLWKSVADISTLKETKKRQAPQLSVAEVQDLIGKLKKPHADIVEAMVYTGMHWKELEGEWECRKDRVVIKGANKSEYRDRVVPLIKPGLVKPQRSNLAFRRAIRSVRNDLSPYSFRRTYAHWMEMAGIPRSRRRTYLGHSGARDTTDIYEAHQVDAFLKEDAQLMRKYLNRRQVQIEMPKGPNIIEL